MKPWATFVGVVGGVTGVSLATGSMSGAWAWAQGMLGTLLDPARMINFAMWALGYVVQVAGFIIPGNLGTQVAALGTTITGIRVDGALNLVYYFIQPVFDINLLKGAIGACIIIWVVTSAYAVIRYVYSFILNLLGPIVQSVVK